MRETEIVMPHKDPHALAAGWTKCITEDNNETTSKARLRIKENISVKQLVERTESALCIFFQKVTLEYNLFFKTL